jgi:hypothetical protein
LQELAHFHLVDFCHILDRAEFLHQAANALRSMFDENTRSFGLFPQGLFDRPFKLDLKLIVHTLHTISKKGIFFFA